MTEETWKTHPTTGLVVSDRGRVIVPKTNRHPEHITYGCTNGKGYKQIKFQKKLYQVHRLVAETFIPNTDNLPCVNHKDENKSKNSVNNLEWCTVKYNTNYGTRVERIVEKRSKTVYQYTKDGILVNRWSSVNECGRNGYSIGAVSQCCNGKLPHYKGFIWSYVCLS